ncbi:TetR/AcrR family transcriptional regulator [Gordonia otitidis]|uniref:TetR/AcrR family transcriptional regulator n=1 Tax=Gordonia otitidis TaxID=249058 RepID=UPI001D1393FF|nr:TetR/AcrR family transcriptional regulator [Gordonia otitidis]UEA61618.1 TetR/AcrR family transcriptional regulator [Gordonia otitidis]
MPAARSLHLDEIVEAAIRILEREGPDALSMRRLAVDLGTKPMTLYNYVPNKSALLGLALSEVAARIPWDAPSGAPRERMISVAVDMYEKMRGIGWLVPILRDGTTVGTPALALADTFLAAALELGMTPTAALSTWRSVWYLVASELQWQDTLSRRSAEEKSWFERIDATELDDYPTIRSLLPAWPRYSAGFDLRDAITAQVDGMLARHATGVDS